VAEKPTAALFVRIPREQARALDRLAFESRRHKQAVVSDLLARGIDAQFAAAVGDRVEAAVETRLARAAARVPSLGPAEQGGGPASRRVTIETIQEPDTVVGRHAFRPFEPDVLTLEEVAELLAVEPAAVERLAGSGELPGRRIGEAWRFARAAVLAWLAHAPLEPAPGHSPVPDHVED
jgi:excisionase family DNA binding protein